MWAPLFGAAHETGLFHRADIIGLARAASLSGANVVAVTPAVGRFHPWERRAVAYIVDLHAVANACAVFFEVDKNASHYTGGDIHHVVNGPAAVRESSQVSHQETETLL